MNYKQLDGYVPNDRIYVRYHPQWNEDETRELQGILIEKSPSQITVRHDLPSESRQNQSADEEKGKQRDLSPQWIHPKGLPNESKIALDAIVAIEEIDSRCS